MFAFIIGWLIVIAGALWLLDLAVFFLMMLITALLSPFSKKANEFYEKHFEIRGGIPWPPWF